MKNLPQQGNHKIAHTKGIRRLATAAAAASVALLVTATAVDVRAEDQSMRSVSPDDPSLKWGPCPEVFAKGCEVAVLNGDPAKGPSDVYLRMPKNYDMPVHWHTSAEHIVLVKGKFSATFEGNKKAAGPYIYIPSKVPHWARCDKSGPCVIFISFESPVDAVAAVK